MKIDSSSFETPELQIPFEDIQEVSHNGATSVSYKVRIHNKWHFLKRPKAEFTDNPLYVAAFEKEFDLGYTLDHPNIVRYLSKRIDKDGIYILTEFVDGVTLTDYVRSNPNFVKDSKEVKRLLLQLCDALNYLHSHNIIHYDLKPDNILITRNGSNVKLIDLGFAYSDCYSAIKCGTKAYSAPEQFTSPETCDATTDIFALGRVIEFLFGGNHIPYKYRNIVRRATNLNPEKRFANVLEVISQINRRSKVGYAIIPIAIILLFMATYLTRHKSDVEIQESAIPYSDTSFVFQNEKVENEKELQSNSVDATIAVVSETEKNLLMSLRKDIVPILHDGYSDFYATYKNITPENYTHIYQEFIKAVHNSNDSVRVVCMKYVDGVDKTTELALFSVWEEEELSAQKRYIQMLEEYQSEKQLLSNFNNELSRRYRDLFEPYTDTLRRFRSSLEYERGEFVIDSLSAIGFLTRDSLILHYTELLPKYGDRFIVTAQENLVYWLTNYYRVRDNFERYGE